MRVLDERKNPASSFQNIICFRLFVGRSRARVFEKRATWSGGPRGLCTVRERWMEMRARVVRCVCVPIRPPPHSRVPLCGTAPRCACIVRFDFERRRQRRPRRLGRSFRSLFQRQRFARTRARACNKIDIQVPPFPLYISISLVRSLSRARTHALGSSKKMESYLLLLLQLTHFPSPVPPPPLRK